MHDVDKVKRLSEAKPRPAGAYTKSTYLSLTERPQYGMKKHKLITTIPEILAHPRSVVSEQYRTLRANLQFLMRDKGMKTLMVTSAEAGAGKTTTMVNLATAFASQGTKVLYIDGDLRKPTSHRRFGVTNSKGLTSCIVNELPLKDAIQTIDDVPNLGILTAGPIPPNPAECLNAHAMNNILKAAREVYDLIIIDAPPALVVGDAKVLASKTDLVDGVLIVSRYGQTKKTDLAETKAAMEQVNAKILGGVVNDTPKSKHNSYYGV